MDMTIPSRVCGAIISRRTRIIREDGGWNMDNEGKHGSHSVEKYGNEN
jgi:hypothetical protein